MKEAYFNTIYSVTDHVPQFSFTFLYKAARQRGEDGSELKGEIDSVVLLVVFCCVRDTTGKGQKCLLK